MKNPDVNIVFNKTTVEAAADEIVNDWMNNQTCMEADVVTPEHIKSGV